MLRFYLPPGKTSLKLWKLSQLNLCKLFFFLVILLLNVVDLWLPVSFTKCEIQLNLINFGRKANKKRTCWFVGEFYVNVNILYESCGLDIDSKQKRAGDQKMRCVLFLASLSIDLFHFKWCVCFHVRSIVMNKTSVIQ